MKLKKGGKMKEEKDGNISKLKARVRRLEKDKKELISKVNTLEQVLKRNFEVLKGSVEDLSVEELIEAAKNDKTIKEAKKDAKKPVENNPEMCPKCEQQTLKIMEIRNGKICICSNCSYRSKM